MKKAFKWIGIVLLSPLLLFIILAVLLYVPPIQNWVVQRLVSYASEETGMEITIAHVDIDFPLDLGIDGLRIVQGADTIADVERAVADVQFWPLLKGNVVLDGLELRQAKVNTLDFVGDMRLQGVIGELTLSSPGIHPGQMEMELLSPRLKDAQLSVFMSDTAAIDTSTTGWRIHIDRFDLERTQLSLVMDSAALFGDDANRIQAYMGTASLHDAHLDLGLGRFAFGKIDWDGGRLSYNHELAISDLSLGLDSLYSYGDELRLGIAHGSMREDSTGMQLTTLQGRMSMNGEAVSLHDFDVKTPHSHLAADADLNLTGTSDVTLNGSIGRSDLMAFSPELSSLPDAPLLLRGHMTGTTEAMDIDQLTIDMPAVLHAETSGQLGRLDDIQRLLAQLELKATLYDGTALSRLLDLPAGYRIPHGLQLAGTLAADDGRYHARMKAREGSGQLDLDGTYNPRTESYAATLEVSDLNLRHFMPHDSIGKLTAVATVSGRGTDIQARGSQMDADIQLYHLEYGEMQLDSVLAVASLRDGVLTASGDLAMSDIDMQALGLGTMPSTLALTGSIDLESDLRNRHKLSALLSHITIRDTLATHYPEDVGLLLKVGEDTTTVRMQSGDLILKFESGENYDRLLTQLTAITDTLTAQMAERTIDQQQLKRLLPTAHLYVTSQQDNPLADILRTSTGIDFRNLDIDITTSPSTGINGTARLDRLVADGMQFDTIRVNLADKGRGLTFNGRVANGRKNPMATFNVRIDGLLQEHGTSFGVRYFDEQNQLNTRLGARAEMMPEGLRFQLMPSQPTIGYKLFDLNDDNFLFLDHRQKLEANIDLKASDGTHLKIYTEDQDSTMLQDITISAHQLNLGELTHSLPFLPAIAGTLEGDYHLLMDQEHSISVASDMTIREMAYEGSYIGNLGSEFVYLLREDGTHVVDATLLLDDESIGLLQGSLLNNGTLDASVELTSMPLSIANGFMPDQLFGFEGTANGTLSLKGYLSSLMTNGEITFSDGYLLSDPYGIRMRFGDTPLSIKRSQLTFNDFQLFATNTSQRSQAASSPLNINGSVDLLGNEQESINLRLTARNFQLINTRQKRESVAYGKMFVNFFARLSGSLEELRMRGRLDVLGNTDLNYILLDSPLSTDNQMDDLVQFTDFSDTTQVVIQRPESDALNIDVTLSIDQGAHLRCALNADQTNYVDLLGGGDLRMRMDDDGLSLTGRYTVESGMMKYSLPVIPLKTFTIKEGSYVDFTGQADNPTLNLTATERIRSTVTGVDGQNRSVSFDCGVVITQTLENMGLQFTISAPEDMQMQSELAAMSVEQRSKLAVTMLTTGMYLSDGNTNAFSMNSALSSFLQNEINNITSGALKTVDLQVGLDNTTNASGEIHTDYSFRFAKRFWNNRLNVQIGGRVSTDTDMQGQNRSFFDNVTMEYRLSPTKNQYVKLFYNQNVYDWLEGYTGEYGGGFIWKRKLDRLIDIFRSDNSNMPTRQSPRPSRTDTIVPPQDSIHHDSIQ
ncbi:MAG: translocation/assembly module TamB domain-containing protein [Prevotella sp.]|nr:translocation/assembly module TamB domain-containing protein [Prevotella sp.]